MMAAVRNLRAQYGHCTVKQTYENVSNNVAEVTNGLWVSLAIHYIAIRITEDIGLCVGRNVGWINA